MEKEITLRAANGIPVYAYRNPSLSGFYLSLYLKAGSMYESAESSGITHFMEHALIRNVNACYNGELYRMLDRYGIEFNASTYNEMVQFYVSGAKEHINISSEILSKLLSPIILSPAEIRTERDRIKAEIRESDERSSLAAFTAGIVHEGTSLARTITGTNATVGAITRRKLEEYRKSVFTAENVFVYLTGSFTDSDLSELCRHIGSYELQKGEIHDNIAPVSQNFGKRAPVCHIKNADFTMVRFNFDLDMSSLCFGEDDLMYDILLGGYSSRFFIEMSERSGLFYDLTGAVERYRNIGNFSFSFEVRSDLAVRAVEMALRLIVYYKQNALDESECMKAGYVDNSNMLYDDSRDLNFTLAYDNHIMNAGYTSLDERKERYRAITPEQMRLVFCRVFRPENLVLTVKGNKRRIDKEGIDRLLRDFADGRILAADLTD